jgi:hypothetical protein
MVDGMDGPSSLFSMFMVNAPLPNTSMAMAVSIGGRWCNDRYKCGETIASQID